MSGFDPDATFRTFEAATNEKAITAEILSALLRNAIGTGRVLVGDQALELYVPGIGEGLQAVGYAQALHDITGRPISFSSDEPSGDLAEAARRRLLALPFVQRVDIAVGSAFAPDAPSASRIDFAELSHMLYYVPERAAVARMLGAIVERLSPTGIACFAHNIPGSNIMEMMARYSPLVLPNPVPVVAQAAERLGLALFTLDYRSALAFESADLLARLRSPNDVADDDVARTARLVECLCQRSLGDLARAGLLERALEDLRERLDHRARLEIRNRVQVVPSRALAASDHASALLRASVEQTAAEAHEIERRHPLPTPWEELG